MSPPVTFDGLLPREITIQFIHDLLMTGDRAYEIPSLEVYPLISLVGLSVSLPQLDTPKRLNVLTLIATLGIGISLFTKLTESFSIQIPGHPHLSNLGYPTQPCQC